ncbi:hypothetical protein Fleli_0344 [Bernardetia litoralis DSM 6794]|uniref:Lipoprotein n=1 Tax=Bernardetia litoralis (strain ATCC 23117 / DSM 6794 / NBRC 15988 / NCIMB 1366 / Fx l1 / Sio-4) TaxID=880071 RepID=I4AFU0_BERLS|nr:hypothetical protein [Bernardetia litoralis]AFM02825.1 hypothetical protein Fleli_0344 [Bernardetia litoralis DSM 6794]
MKKIKSIYILFVFAAISSYGLWACTGTTTSETTSETDSTQVEEIEEVEKPDTRPASAAIDTNFYIKATIQDTEYTFNYLPLLVDDKYNLLMSNLFRIERCADDHCKQSFYLQAHNFDLNQTPPFILKEGQDGKVRKEIILNFIMTNNQGKFKYRWKDSAASPFEITIEKIEGEIYEGTFKGKIEKAKMTQQDSVINVTGSFRTKMIIKKTTV